MNRARFFYRILDYCETTILLLNKAPSAARINARRKAPRRIFLHRIIEAVVVLISLELE